MRLLDLFCCAGGAAQGYADAGFDEIVGVDINPQPRYPYTFVQADAVEYLRDNWQHFDAIHASPPCQAYSAMKHMPDAREHAELVDVVRDMLDAIGRPYVLENVPGAPMREPITLCGSMFGLGASGFQLRRHRLFDSNVSLRAPGACDHQSPTIGIYGGHVRCRSGKFWRETGADFPGYDKKALANEAMGIDWMTMNQLSEAIPPAYTEWIGEQLLVDLRRAEAWDEGYARGCLDGEMWEINYDVNPYRMGERETAERLRAMDRANKRLAAVRASA